MTSTGVTPEISAGHAEGAKTQLAAGIRENERMRTHMGEVFGDDVVAAAMIDRLVHHAEVTSLKGDSYRLKDRDLGRVPAAKTND
jgi:IstB-like ATP binding protein